MLAIGLMVLGVLRWNLVLTRRARARMRALGDYALVSGA